MYSCLIMHHTKLTRPFQRSSHRTEYRDLKRIIGDRKIISYSLNLCVFHKGKANNSPAKASTSFPRWACCQWVRCQLFSPVLLLPGEIWDQSLKYGEVGHSAGCLSQATGFALSSTLYYPKRVSWQQLQ